MSEHETLADLLAAHGSGLTGTRDDAHRNACYEEADVAVVAFLRQVGA